ncbi:lmo0937 family membrane protein [Pyxidicoccus parkwayensis]|uniref:Lmo0937 family membrane protein n=1 Tax=Pyxidicoccus parkwayensis TaxID=2813578 RepID=A0ABX7P8W5_9BACT|nr:lmo0937 family membrane protein [Pyxidicoccus parkwaysis]QSQ26878.1 lmo0937 family membrane protein [Pyxidicoccus parkwaysis]
MYWTMGMILLVLWGLGLTAGSTEGYWVHLLLLFSFVAFLLAVASHGRRTTTARRTAGS